MHLLTALGGASLPAGAVLAATEVVADVGPDWTGIAALVSSVGGVIGIVGGLWLSSRRQKESPRDELYEKLLREKLGLPPEEDL